MVLVQPRTLAVLIRIRVAAAALLPFSLHGSRIGLMCHAHAWISGGGNLLFLSGCRGIYMFCRLLFVGFVFFVSTCRDDGAFFRIIATRRFFSRALLMSFRHVFLFSSSPYCIKSIQEHMSNAITCALTRIAQAKL